MDKNFFNILSIVFMALTILPLSNYVYHQIKTYGKDNGFVWKVRRLTLVFVSAIALLLLMNSAIRLFSFWGFDPYGLLPEIIRFVVNGLVMAASWFAIWEAKQINHHE